MFQDQAAKAGIAKVMVSGDPKEKKYLLESVGGGLAVLDYNNDGWMDLYVVNGGTLETARSGQGSRYPGALYRNNRDGTFTDVTLAAGVRNSEWGKGALAADFNNDGWVDLYLCNLGPNILFQNNRDGTFSNVTKRAGVGDPRWSASAAAADYDRDGDLDLFVVNYLEFDLNQLPVSGKFCSYRGIPVACGPRGLKGAGDTLYRNNGDGSFTDVSVAAGVHDPQGLYGLACVWGDYDNDGDADLFVANDTTPNLLYRNNGDGTFTDVAPGAGVAFSEDGREQAGMGAELEDLNNDGWLDLFVTNFSEDWNTLRLNQKNGLFDDYYRGLGNWRRLNARLELGSRFLRLQQRWIQRSLCGQRTHLSTGRQVRLEDLLSTARTSFISTQAGRRLLNVSQQAGPGFQIQSPAGGRPFLISTMTAALTLPVAVLDETPLLLMNQPAGGQNWLLVRLEGTKSNKGGVGGRVTVKCGPQTQTREIKAGGSFASSSDVRAHFGLGSCRQVDEIAVRWPSGNVSTRKDVEAGQVVTIRE
jgi:hypothetical protein